MRTKFSKKIVTFFFPVDDLIKEIFIDWVLFLKNEKHFDLNAPLFPSTKLSLDVNDKFSREELDCIAWQSTAPIRHIVEDAFEAAGLNYYNPHSFRDTIVHLGYELCKTPETLKAWSQNIGHNSILTTLESYGHIEKYNQGKIIKQLRRGDDGDEPMTKKDFKEILISCGNFNITGQ